MRKYFISPLGQSRDWTWELAHSKPIFCLQTISPAPLALALSSQCCCWEILWNSWFSVLFHDITNLQKPDKQTKERMEGTWKTTLVTHYTHVTHYCHHLVRHTLCVSFPFSSGLFPSAMWLLSVLVCFLLLIKKKNWPKAAKGKKGFASSYSLWSIIKRNQGRNWRRDTVEECCLLACSSCLA